MRLRAAKAEKVETGLNDKGWGTRMAHCRFLAPLSVIPLVRREGETSG